MRPQSATLLRRLSSLDKCTTSREGLGCVHGTSTAEHHTSGSSLPPVADQTREASTSSILEAPLRRGAYSKYCHHGIGNGWLKRHSTEAQTNPKVYTYHGPLSQTLKNLKRLSISGAAVAVFGSPILVMNTAEAMPFAAQASICCTLAGFGIFTTSLLHWFTSPYIHQLDFNRDLKEGEIRTLSIFAQPRLQSFHESEVKYPDTMQPQVTFEVRGKPFYLDPNAFEDKDLLQRLTPPDPAAEDVAIQEASDTKHS